MLVRFNLMLTALLVICALGLVTSQHRARKLFIDLERAQANAGAHEVRWNQLQVEQTELATSALIDARARRELGMQAVPADRTLHLSLDPVTRTVSLSQPWIEKAAGGKPGGVRAAAAGGARPAAQAGAQRGPASSAASARALPSAGPARAAPAAAAPKPVSKQPAGAAAGEERR
ncbi:cell division protein FtsL [Burkholderiaceae bacterium FT117]|uniref:cell division protein FtsL n=1 Tax=Zeimonas sediminis TaxID=2944268 RepID=UPI002342CDFB|nr:cell division protein FtsL [Zeimonas sediminis]MCM5570790.1 cell division protein FtsL [Zeimonas sediminis]